MEKRGENRVIEHGIPECFATTKLRSASAVLGRYFTRRYTLTSGMSNMRARFGAETKQYA